MTTPYRQAPLPELTCPRCTKRKLPPLDVAECPGGCGTWVTAFAASEVFADDELGENRVTAWWRPRVACPQCSEQMLLRGMAPGLLQGCERHGFFIDADTIEHTGLARGGHGARIAAKRADVERSAAETNRLQELESERAREHELREQARQRERELAPYVGIVAALRNGNIGPMVDELRRLDLLVANLTARLETLERVPRS